MSKPTYKISHITDIASVPPEHWDELFLDLRHGVGLLMAFHAALVHEGHDKSLSETCPSIDFTPNGRGEVKVTHNNEPIMISTLTKVTP